MCFLCSADFAGWSSYFSYGALLVNGQWPDDGGKQGQAFFFFSSRYRLSMIVWVIIGIFVIWSTCIQFFSDKTKYRHAWIAAILEQSAEVLTLVFCIQQSFKYYVKLPLTEKNLNINYAWTVFGVSQVLKIISHLFNLKNIVYSR